MTTLTEDMKSLVNTQKMGFVATVSSDGSPNLSPKGTTITFDDETLVFSLINSDNTLTNLKSNPKVEINVVDPQEQKGFKFSGDATIHTEGEQLDKAVSMYKENGVTNINTIVLVKVNSAVELASPKYDA